MQHNTPLGRFAPSPTGRMHLGNIFSAMLSWLSVRSKGGRWLLRIEDIDPQRSRQEYADLIMSDLEWLGLTWDEGPYYQSKRSEIYEEHLQRLQQTGLMYPCYCTRADILATQAPHETDGRVVYKGTCRPDTLTAQSFNQRSTCAHVYNINKVEDNAEPSRMAALRLAVPDEYIPFVDGHYGEQGVNLATHCGDFIVRRKDGAWAYQLAVVVDDALMGVTEVVRGRDLLLSSPQQMYLARLFGYPSPEFCHLPLLCNANGQRLSKRDKSLDMESLRRNFTPEEIIGRLAFSAGLTPTAAPIHPEELVKGFSWDRVPKEDLIMRD